MKLPTIQQVSARRMRASQIVESFSSGDRPVLNGYILSTFTVNSLAELLVEALDERGAAARFRSGAFGQVIQELLDPHSALYTSQPDMLVCVLHLEDLLGSAFDRPAHPGAQAIVEQQMHELTSAFETMLSRMTGITCYIVPIKPASPPSAHLLSYSAPERGEYLVEMFYQAVRELESLSPRIVMVDWDAYVRRLGAQSLEDDRLWYMARMRLSPIGLSVLAGTVAEHHAAYRGLVSKVIAVDLDNTLWGGVIGEDGMSGIVLGEEGVGFAFQAFQKELLKLYDMGVVLAILSKNNHADAWEVIEQHPGMILRSSHFAAVRINWQDKATNLQDIAEELNLGIDSFVFLDDNPVEREWMRAALPQVRVPELPADPVERVSFLRELPFFRRIALTDADRKRAESYKTQGLRRELQEKSGSIEAFIASLEQVITIQPVHDGSIARAAQMAQRTNQFNLTSQRYTVGDLEAMRRDPQIEMVTLSVRDKFGDNGITGLAILRLQDETAHIDTLLLSCRVLGRRVEDVLLHYLLQRSQERGAQQVIGHYLPTPKNQQVAQFYPARGFVPLEDGVFSLSLAGYTYALPEGITVEFGNA